jgi:CheY-like chemotaxis protein
MLTKTTRFSRRVLIADDDPVMRRLVTSVATKEGYEAVVVSDGREACRVLNRDADFSAAIFDMMMPHLEGLDVIRHMQTEKRLKRIPVIMITSEQGLKLMKDSFAAGVTVFLPKPFRADQLQTMLRVIPAKSSGAGEPPIRR